MKKLSSIAALAALAAFAATPASAAQILLSASNIIGNLGTSSASYVVDQQTGGVSAGQPWTGSSGGLIVIDLGQEYDVGQIDFFGSVAHGVRVAAGNAVAYNGWGSWLLNGGGTELVSGELIADGGGDLTAQSFQAASVGKFRYLQIGFSPLSNGPANYFLNEIRVFERDLTSAVPEPATWAMMITGFGLAGAALRRRRQTAVGVA